MVKPRFLYVSLFIILASTGRFLALVLQDQGLTDSEIGLSLALGVFSGAFTTPYFSRRADLKGTLLVLNELVIAHFVSSLILLPLPWLQDGNSQWKFPVVLIWRLLSAGFLSPTGSILDAYAMRILGSEKHKSRYGEERLWGAVSWALTSVLMGLMMDLLPTTNSLAVSGFFLLVGSLWSIRLIRQSPATPTANPEELLRVQEIGNLAFLRSTTDHQMLAFYLIVFALGVGMALVEKLLFLFLVDELHASRLICGLSVVITVAIEIPLFRYSERLVKTASYVNLYLIAIIAYCSRVLAYTLMQTSWGVLTVEPLVGLFFVYNIPRHRFRCVKCVRRTDSPPHVCNPQKNTAWHYHCMCANCRSAVHERSRAVRYGGHSSRNIFISTLAGLAHGNLDRIHHSSVLWICCNVPRGSTLCWRLRAHLVSCV